MQRRAEDSSHDRVGGAVEHRERRVALRHAGDGIAESTLAIDPDQTREDHHLEVQVNTHLLMVTFRVWFLEIAVSGVNYFVLMNHVYEPRSVVLFAASRPARPKSAFSRTKLVAEVRRRGAERLSRPRI